MNIDGVSGGVSGLPQIFLSQVAQTDGDYLNQIAEHKLPRACDSIWIFFQGKSIRLAFLSFETEAELKGYVKIYINTIIQDNYQKHKWI